MTVTIKQGKERLLRLADFLEHEVHEENFSMEFWYHSDDRADEATLERLGFMDPPGCDTTACALGWATAIWPELVCLYDGTVVPLCKRDAVASETTPLAKQSSGLLFRLSRAGHNELFESHWHDSAKNVAKRIREFVSESPSWGFE